MGNLVASAEISEIFSSLQGEGPYLGKHQVFVRFGRCNMHCGYCDETDKMKPGPGGYRDWALDSVMDEICRLESVRGPHHSVSLTGGEPLVYSDFLSVFLPELKTLGLKTYLETNGTLPRALRKVIEWTDVVAMDIKPPTSTGDREFWDEHREFLRLARTRDVFVKVVVTPGTSRADIAAAVDIAADVDPNVPFIFQPETELSGGISLKALKKIEEEFMPHATARLKDVRVIPQMHKIWGVQ